MEIVDSFHFLRPWWLLALPCWFLLAYRMWSRRHHQDGWASLCDPVLLGYLTGETTRQSRSRLTLAGLFVAGAASLLALAGPVWQQLPQPVFRAQSGLIAVLDLSSSMKAADLHPDRLTRARHKLQDILLARREGQTGLIVFAGSAFDVVPLTTDNRAILSLLESLDPSMMPKQGSNASLALEHALAMFRRGAIQQGNVVLLTDGIDLDALTVADDLVAAGHRISVLGIGTADGAPIPYGKSGFMKDADGNIVIPRLNEAKLRELAARGNGIYQHIRIDDVDVKALPGLMPAQGEATVKEQLQTDQWREEGPWLVLALVLPLLVLVFRRGVLVIVLGLSLPWLTVAKAEAFEWQDFWQTADQQGQALMQQQQPESASGVFENPQWKGAALYRAEKYKESAKALAGIDSVDAQYNRGNALARAGDLQAAVDAYDQVLKHDATHEDAIFNRDLVKKQMQEQESEKKQSQDGEQSEQDSEKNEPGEGEDQSSANDDKNKQDKQSGQDSSSESGSEQSEEEAGDDQSMSEEQEQKQEEQKLEEEKAAEESKMAKGDESEKESDKANSPKERLDSQSMEEMKAQQQWLRRIPDDPGGLLRRKFRYQYQQQAQQSGKQEAQPW